MNDENLILLGDKTAERCLIQPIGERDEKELDREVELIRQRSDVPFLMVGLPMESWGGDLSPWPAPPVFGDEAFSGGGEETLQRLERELLPRLRAEFSLSHVYYGGYSLGGLFALWAAYRSEVFTGVAAVSPSVWFPGWIEFAADHRPKASKIYLSLGSREERTRNPVMRRVGDCIRKQQELLEDQGVCGILEWNPGNHFQEPELRMAKGFAWLLERG